MVLDRSFLCFYFLTLARILPVSVLSPALGAQLVQGKIRMMIAMILALVMTPSITTNSPPPMLTGVINQLTTGFVFAVISALPFYALQSIGEWIDINRGETLSAILIPQMQSRTSSLGRVYLMLAVVLFFGTGSHLTLVSNLSLSLQASPLDQSLDRMLSGENGEKLLILFFSRMAEFFKIALIFGLPVVVITWTLDLILGFLNRIAPSLQVFFLGLPLKLWFGLAVTGVSLGFCIDHLKEYMIVSSHIFP